jgi:tetratricopeptide (TPR) repeat protein
MARTKFDAAETGRRALNQPQPAAAWRSWPLWLILAIFAATLAAYWPALGAGFVWDDEGFVTRPDLRSLHGLWRIWFDVGATEQYSPILHGAFWLEHLCWGDNPLGYHLVNILLHTTSACLLVALLRRWSIRGAGLAGLIFALHPVCVESVAWIAEQKNTLSTAFYLLAALTYTHWREEKPDRSVFRSYALYFGATALFILALLSKSVAASLPAALLVLCWWRHGTLSWTRDVRPLLPWFALGATMGLFAGWVERRYIGAEGSAFTLTFVQRCLVAGHEIWFYLGKLLWPANLIFIYPRWAVDPRAWPQYLFPLGALALVVAFWQLRPRSRAPLAAYLFFVGSLFPTLGFFNIYAFVFSYVADHWQYLASFGVIVPAAAVLAWAVGHAGPRIRPLACVVVIAILGTLGILTWRQSGMYRDVVAFYETILERNPDAWMANDNLGIILGRSGQLPEAIEHFRRALRSNPAASEVHNNLGIALARSGRPDEAATEFETALQIRPNYANAHFNLGLALHQLGRDDEARAQLEAAASLGGKH